MKNYQIHDVSLKLEYLNFFKFQIDILILSRYYIRRRFVPCRKFDDSIDRPMIAYNLCRMNKFRHWSLIWVVSSQSRYLEGYRLSILPTVLRELLTSRRNFRLWKRAIYDSDEKKRREKDLWIKKITERNTKNRQDFIFDQVGVMIHLRLI